MLWACVLLPHLALDAILRRHADPGAGHVLVDGPPRRRVVRDAVGRLRQAGVRPGQALATAQALAGELHVHARDPQEAARQLDLLAAWAWNYSPQLARFGHSALVVEVGGSRGLFGPWESLQQRWRDELVGMGFRHRLALASNPLAARVLAGARDGAVATGREQLQAQLDPLPVARIGLPASIAKSLERMGLRRLGALRALPPSSLARRFSPRLPEHLERLYGEREVPWQPWRPPEGFEARCEFEREVETVPALLFALRRMLSDLALHLRNRDGGVQHFDLLLEHEDRPASRVRVGLLAPERDAALLFEVTRSRLERTPVPAPVRALVVQAEALPDFVPVMTDLLDARPSQALAWEHLQERLRARLGDQSVQQFQSVADHRPERATRLVVEAQGSADERPPAGPRPAWLLQAPRRFHEARPDVLAGPERIESGWWDGEDARREYCRVLTRDGRQAWIYRRAGCSEWLLHGWFS